uniref:JNK-interacting protein n=2 Tax=Parascaris univalens TaxID=6257 RepID=A0A915BB52_PARUN
MVDTQNNVMETSTNSGSSEVVYGTTGSVGSGDDSRVMSDKVQLLASSIYKEFETMIQKSGEDSVKNLMPLVVNVLESLDLAYLEKEEYSVDLEMLKEDNEQLITQYEREKQLRRAQDQKCLEIEDTLMEQIRELESKIESLESIMRMLELKAKNASDHAARLEEREADQKNEFDKLHERYNVLLRTHIDHMERTKYLMGSDKFEMMQNMPLPSQQLRTKIGMATSLDAGTIRGVSDLISAHMSQSTTVDVNLANHISNEADWQEEFGQSGAEILQSPRDDSSSMIESPRVEQQPESLVEEAPANADVNPPEAEDSLGADLTEEFIDDDGENTMVAAVSEAAARRRQTSAFSSLASEDVEGMGREVENLIKENTELLETKNALNIVKNDLIARVDELSSEQDILREEIRSLEMVRTKMSERIKELETEVRELKEKVEAKSEEDGDDVPMAQRKRFTRLEMARVLMERNQYKERLMELQDAMKWTEMQRAKRLNAMHASKKSSSIWDFFSGLFSHETVQQTHRRPRRSAGGGSDPLSRRKPIRTVDFIDADYASERRAAERRQQYKIVREHMMKEDDGRLHAYGWSLPATVDDPNDSTSIPVPVFCRPLMDMEPSLKIWCASGVMLRGGRTKDGGYIIGDSVFYSGSNSPSDTTPPPEKSVALREAREMEMLAWESSSLVWVCSSNQGRSHVAIVDSNNPNSVIEAFPVCSSHLLCVSSIPGIRESDYPPDDNDWKSFVRGGGFVKDLPADVNEPEEFGAVQWVELRKLESDEDPTPTYCGPDQKPSPTRSRDFSVCEMPIASTSDIQQGFNALSELGVAELKEGPGTLPPHIKDGLSKYNGLSENMTALPTMWMGSQNEYIFIHSAVSEWRKCLRRIKMPDSVLCILHYKGRVFAALANGSIAVFHREESGGWSETGYHTITVGRATSSVRSLSVVAGRIWAAYRNCIIVIDPKDLTVHKVFAAHPRRDSQVRHMQWVGDGVWISIRLDSTLRLYHAHTYAHLQDVDIEPYVTKMLGTNKLDFSYMRTTALLVSCRRLWIGTGTGVIISVPLTESNGTRVETKVPVQGVGEEVRGPGGLIRVYSDLNSERVTPGSFIPYCDMARAQLSFHGHKDSVKFFLAVPGIESEVKKDEAQESRKMLVVSGGDGYIDFRMGEEEDNLSGPSALRPRDMSHLIVWEVDASLSRS